MYSVVSFFGDSFWEKKFITTELLPAEYTFCSAKPTDSFDLSKKYIIIFSSAVTPLVDILNVCKTLHPVIVFHLSDEFGVDPQYLEVSKYTKLYVRNYYHSCYPNVDALYIPLGYNSNMFNCHSFDITHIPASERPLAWSFVGQIRRNRRRMITWFKKLNIGKPCSVRNGITPEEMFNIYSNSVFIPSERGHKSLDCFRIYEACVAGAIPVVVGDFSELKETFKHEESPPWIFSNSWLSALDVCTSIARKPNELNAKQQEVIQWWKKRVTTINEKILTHLRSC